MLIEPVDGRYAVHALLVRRDELRDQRLSRRAASEHGGGGSRGNLRTAKIASERRLSDASGKKKYKGTACPARAPPQLRRRPKPTCRLRMRPPPLKSCVGGLLTSWAIATCPPPVACDPQGLSSTLPDLGLLHGYPISRAGLHEVDIGTPGSSHARPAKISELEHIISVWLRAAVRSASHELAERPPLPSCESFCL